MVPVGLADESGRLRGPLLWGDILRIGRRISNENLALLSTFIDSVVRGVCPR